MFIKEPVYFTNENSSYYVQTSRYLKRFEKSARLCAKELKKARKSINQFFPIGPAEFIALDQNVHVNSKERRVNMRITRSKGN